jgi:hypothetical protein
MKLCTYLLVSRGQNSAQISICVEFCERSHSESHALLTDINELLIVAATSFISFGYNAAEHVSVL